ncbi:S8 family peptidase [Planococcus sp. X10-3]|uniref:S8 family peptidase n=1 Tax=Planococcus sp. X10-3 TaxID=3061240 RepID=UPI003BB00CA3
MKKFTALLTVFIAIFGFAFLVTAENQDSQRAIVILEEGASPELLNGTGADVIEYYANVSAAYIKGNEETLAKLATQNGVEMVEKDQFIAGKAQLPSWGLPHINADVSWESGYTGKGVKIGVIDSGISPHPDLKIAGGVSIVEDNPSYYDVNGHGTHVAGIIGALDNSIGVVGVAPEAELYAIRVFGHDNSGYLSDVIGGIDWAITNEMDIINMSLGAAEGSELFQEVIRKAAANNILIIAAAGNAGQANPAGDSVEYPARYEEVIAVSAVDNLSARAYFSSAGPAVDLAAPGVAIRSTFLNDTYFDMTGTSMATPFVAGQAALVKEAYPGLTNEQVKSLLGKNAIDLGVPGTDPVYGAGLIQAQPYMEPAFGKYATKNPVNSMRVSKEYVFGDEKTVHQLKAKVKLLDGTKIDITDAAQWSSEDPSIATVDKGRVNLIEEGETALEVEYEGLDITIHIEVTASFDD